MEEDLVEQIEYAICRMYETHGETFLPLLEEVWGPPFDHALSSHLGTTFRETRDSFEMETRDSFEMETLSLNGCVACSRTDQSVRQWCVACS